MSRPPASDGPPAMPGPRPTAAGPGAPPGPPGYALWLAIGLQAVISTGDGLVLIRSEVLSHDHFRAVPVRAGVIRAVVQRHQQRMVCDLDVVVHVFPRHAGRDQADRRRIAVVVVQFMLPR